MPFSQYINRDFFQGNDYYDEVIDPVSEIRPHWKKIVHHYQKIGIQELIIRRKEVERLLRANGVTYNIYGDPEGVNRPWMLDPIPSVINAEEWNRLEKGLQQRARLLNLLLKDLYSERSVIRDGVVPMELIYYHNGFLREVDGIKLTDEYQLITYSADLARGPDGQLWVLNDRTDAPSGAGYTLENRAAMMRVFPNLFRESQVKKIGSYYNILKNTLAGLGLINKDNPRIVVLSPGSGNETYFEHAYLSAYLGYTLVFGEDLTVRDGYVWLKTLKGLEKIDVILRRLDDLFCDPLELRSDSQLGVVGLIDVIRKGKVLVVNPLGCRIIENPGLMAFLPGICRYFLKEDLILPSVATWWCGQTSELNYVIEHFDRLIIKRIYRFHGYRSVFGGKLSPEEKGNLIEQMKAKPYLFVGQEIVNFSTTPSLIHDRLEARNSVFRSYLVADTENKAYHVMPGGMSRSSPTKGVFIVSNQDGGISKDTWVITSEEEEEVKPHLQTLAPMLNPVENIIPSRTGENLYWLGRYLERCTSIIRLMRIVLRKYNESDRLPGSADEIAFKLLLQSLTHITGTYPGFIDEKSKGTLDNPEPELINLMIDKNNFGSLSYSINQFLVNGYSIRDRLSLDTWRIIDSIDESWNNLRTQTNISLPRIYDWLDNIIIRFMAFTGLNVENMIREESWRLMNIGRKMESAVALCNMFRALLVVKMEPQVETDVLESVLITNESLVTYRYRNRSQINLEAVLELLLVDHTNPRSLVFYLEEVNRHVNDLPKVINAYQLTSEKKLILEALTATKLLDIKSLVSNQNQQFIHFELDEFLARVLDLLGEASNSIATIYFNHLENKYHFMQNPKLPEV